MKLSIIFPDRTAVLGGVATGIDTSGFPLADAIHAVQWDGKQGEIEWADSAIPNAAISDMAMFQPLIVQAETKIAEQVRAAQLAKEQAARAADEPREPAA